MTSPPSGFGVFDSDFIRCPFGAYDELREGKPATHVSEGKGFWLVTDHELVREVVGDVSQFSSESGPLGSTRPSAAALERMAAITPPSGLQGRVDTLLTLDPPGHTRNRKLISRAFTPASVTRYEELTRRICRELIADWADGETIDFVAQFAVPLPVRVIARALDVPDDLVDDFKRWSDASVAPIGADLDDDQWVEVQRQLLELGDFIQSQIDRKRAAGPADDIMSNLVHARLDKTEQAELGGETRLQLSDDEIHSIVRQVLVAGNETTSNLLTQSIVILGDHEQWWTQMHDDSAVVPAVVEEALRYVTPSAVNQRAAAQDLDFHGVEIPTGDVVLVCYLAADHDPAVFPDPQQFNPERSNLGDHLAFGRGIHFCPGAALARMETRIAFEELTAAIAGYTIPPADDLAWNSSFQLRAIQSLPFVPRMRTASPASNGQERA